MAQNQERTAGGNDRKTAEGIAGNSKGPERQQQGEKLTDATSQQGAGSGQNREGKDGGASPQAGSAARSTRGGGSGAGKG
jgi:hypothetical protein